MWCTPQDLAARTKALAERATDIQNTGLTGAYEKFFRNLEGKLAQAQGIVNARNATASAVTVLMELIEDLRYEFIWDLIFKILLSFICSICFSLSNVICMEQFNECS